jgi:hypothetical protein
MDDSGTIVGTGVAADVQNNIIFELIKPLVWSSPAALPQLLGEPDVITIDSPDTPDSEDAYITRDGDIVGLSTPMGDYTKTKVRVFQGMSQSAAASEYTVDVKASSWVIRDPARDGTLACGEYHEQGSKPWVLRPIGEEAAEILSATNTQTPESSSSPIDFSKEPNPGGTTPPTGAQPGGPEYPAVSIDGNFLIHNGSKWVGSESLKGARTLSRSGTAIGFEIDNVPAVWRNGEVVKIAALCPALAEEGISNFDIIDINDQGLILIKDGARAGLLLPVEIEQQNYNAATGIRFCRWLDAFQGIVFDNEFADEDRDHFRIRIPGTIPNLTKIKIKSTGLHNAVIDGAAVAKPTDGDYEVEFKPENGAMVSNWILLVSDGDDDKYYNGKGTDDHYNDQTLLADFESEIIVTFPELDNAEVVFTAQKPLGNITLDTVYLSPTGDVPQDMQDLMHRHIAKMQEIYRQMGVRVAWASIEGETIPQAILNAVPNPDPTKPDIQPVNQLNDSESSSVRQQIRGRQVPEKHIRIGYVNATIEGTNENFELIDILGFTTLGTDGVLVSLGSTLGQETLGVTAHEVGHTLGLEHVTEKHWLMTDGGLHWENNRRDSKRFEEGEFNTIKNKEDFYVPLQ